MVDPVTNPISLLVTIGNNVMELHEHLKQIYQVQLVNYLFDESAVPESLRRHGWTVGYRNENPSKYILSALSLFKSSNSSIFVISVPGDCSVLDVLLTKNRNMFSNIVIATSTETPLSSFIVRFKCCLDQKKHQKTCHSTFEKKLTISPRDIQKHADYLIGLESHIRKFISSERNYIQIKSISHVACQLLNEINIQIPKHLSELHKPQDTWKWISEHCNPENFFRLQFAFDRILTYGPSRQRRIGNALCAYAKSYSPLIKYRKGMMNSSHIEECEWAVLVAVPQHGSFQSVRSTSKTASSLGNIREAFSDVINNTHEANVKVPICSVKFYASTVSSEDHLFCKESEVFENVLKLSSGATICRAWETLAKHAVSKGATRLLLSDGSLIIKNENWIFRAEQQFQAGSVCVEILGKENNPNQGIAPRLIAVHVLHVCIFGKLFPHNTGNKEGSFTFTREIWERTGWFATIYADITQNMCQENSTSDCRYLQSDAASFKDKPLEDAFSVLRKCKYVIKNPFLSNCYENQFQLDESEFHILPRIDVIIPTFRLPVELLRRIVSLRASIPCLVTFWIVVDNPTHPNLSRLVSELDNVTVPHPYTQGHDCEHNGLYQTRVLVHPKNYGASAARNTGLMASLADWALLLDDDVTPSQYILDAYLSAILKHDCYNNNFTNQSLSQDDINIMHKTDFNGRVDILAGVTHFPEPHLFWQHSLVISKLCSYYSAPVAWPVTANACIRVRHNPQLFDTKFPKSGGGEDIEYGLRIRQSGKKMIVVSDALATHPWFGMSAFEVLIHTSKWMRGDSLIAEDMKHTNTIMVAPGWAECIVLYVPIGILIMVYKNIGFVSFLKPIFSIFITDFLWRVIGLSNRAFKHVGFQITLLVASFSALLQMSQDVIRVGCHLKRYRVDCLVRKLDLKDGEESTIPLQIVSLLKFFLFCLVIFF